MPTQACISTSTNPIPRSREPKDGIYPILEPSVPSLWVWSSDGKYCGASLDKRPCRCYVMGDDRIMCEPRRLDATSILGDHTETQISPSSNRGGPSTDREYSRGGRCGDKHVPAQHRHASLTQRLTELIENPTSSIYCHQHFFRLIVPADRLVPELLDVLQ